ncbi:hypothetical protein B1H20_23475 [Streptomyces violaceoruber]|uniref:Uncharacterized protein n=1 Tax=Streptomyces violaceoruber TaxID=1935 RepID=A0A1V0UFJ9_STRVN|nr:hypothetical protein B1H20_23475 [Streptomyces violaceoruber]
MSAAVTGGRGPCSTRVCAPGTAAASRGASGGVKAGTSGGGVKAVASGDPSIRRPITLAADEVRAGCRLLGARSADSGE